MCLVFLFQQKINHTKLQNIYNKRLNLEKQTEKQQLILTYQELTNRAKYDESIFKGIQFNKNGQRKLFDTELLFILKAIEYLKKDDFTVLYVGAADGKHINIYHTLFPKIKWILYDPRDFMIKESKQIEIHQEFFTKELCNKYKNIDAFISDIRTMDEADFKKQNQATWQQQVQDDQDMQGEWVKIIQPKIFSLKFKLNWNKDKQKYFKGDIYIQPWNSIFSNETRLIATEIKEIEYNCKEFEEKLFYFNTQIRFQIHQRVSRNQLDVYCPCHDCQLECYLFKEYQKYNSKYKDQDIYDLIKKYSIKKM